MLSKHVDWQADSSIRLKDKLAEEPAQPQRKSEWRLVEKLDLVKRRAIGFKLKANREL